MRFHNGTWIYQGRTYATLRAALRAAWPGVPAADIITKED